MTDIEALVAWLRALKKKGGKGVVGNIDARALGRVADALKRQRAVVKAAQAYVKGSLYDSTALCNALAALPEGDG